MRHFLLRTIIAISMFGFVNSTPASAYNDRGGLLPRYPSRDCRSVTVHMNRNIQGSRNTYVPTEDLDYCVGYKIVNITFQADIYYSTTIGFNIDNRWIGETDMYESGVYNIAPVGRNIIDRDGVRIFFATVEPIYLYDITFELVPPLR